MLNRIDILCCLFNFTPPQASSTLSMIAFAIFDMERYFSFFQTLQTLHSLKYWSKYSFSMCAFSHSPSVEKQEYLKGRYSLSLKEIFKSKIDP